jgi:dephospho-CoA kinase
MRIIGLTGGIGAGKSEVARILSRRGIPVINADQLSREVVEPGSPGLKAIIKRFGNSVLRGDGSLDRKGLARRVFANQDERLTLEGILHPLIRERTEAHLLVLEEGNTPVCILESPLLFEASQDELCDAVITVVADFNLRAKRVKRREGLTIDQFQQRVDAQINDDTRRRLSDMIVENNGSLEDLRRAVNRIKI